jgi:hypothetical protein
MVSLDLARIDLAGKFDLPLKEATGHLVTVIIIRLVLCFVFALSTILLKFGRRMAITIPRVRALYAEARHVCRDRSLTDERCLWCGSWGGTITRRFVRVTASGSRDGLEPSRSGISHFPACPSSGTVRPPRSAPEAV